MDLGLAGKVAVVTGGSRGIGRSIAASLVAEGARVMIVSRKEDSLRAAAEAIGGDVRWCAANVGDDDAARRCIDDTIAAFGGIDILVNNAATNPYLGPTVGVDAARFDKTVQVNLRGPLVWTQAVWNAWMSEHPGVILNVASVGGMRAEPLLGVYNVTKAALIHLTRQLASELGPTRVLGVAPGLVDTDFASVLVENVGEALARSMPTRRIGTPQDIADFVAYLVSPRASWITAETFVIDGGAGVRSSLGA
jgi:NAD(P)-dependent dehydrogenase (short-subunit alcohol dehydrogenase family)